MQIEIPQEVTSAPRFVSSLKGTNVILEGQKAHFECRIEPQNDPKLQVSTILNLFNYPINYKYQQTDRQTKTHTNIHTCKYDQGCRCDVTALRSLREMDKGRSKWYVIETIRF